MLITDKKILLGSGSPRRKMLLEQLGLNFRVVSSNTKEIPLPGLQGAEIAISLAEEKADALKKEIAPGELLISADTIVWQNSTMLGKPADEYEAFQMLNKLNGGFHSVYTAFCIRDNTIERTFCVKSDVFFKKVSEAELKNYIDSYKPFDKAGSYGAQECLPEGLNPCSSREIEFMKENNLNNLFEETSGTGRRRIALIDHIDGGYFNVMGLPVVELVSELRKINY